MFTSNNPSNHFCGHHLPFRWLSRSNVGLFLEIIFIVEQLIKLVIYWHWFLSNYKLNSTLWIFKSLVLAKDSRLLGHGLKKAWAKISANQWNYWDAMVGAHSKRPRKGHECPFQWFYQNLLLFLFPP